MKCIIRFQIEVTADEWPNEEECEKIIEVIEGVDWPGITKQRIEDQLGADLANRLLVATPDL